MPEFKVTIELSQLFIPMACSGILFLGWLLFTYMYIRSMQALHLAMLILFFLGFVFVFSEAMILSVGMWLLDASIGRQFHRIEQLSGAYFMFGIAYFVQGLTDLTPGWKKVNRYVGYAGLGLAVLITIIAFIMPDLFISQASHKAGWETIQADYGRGLEGPLYQVRDALIGIMILYGTGCFIFEMARNRRFAYVLLPFIGFIIAIHGAFVDIMFVYTRVYYDLTPWSSHSRFTVGITAMIVFCMSAVYRKFFDMAHEVERAEAHASAEAEKNLEQNRFIREVLDNGSGSLVVDIESLSATISDFTQHSQEQAAATEEVTASIEEITAGIDSVKSIADEQFLNLELLLHTMEELSEIIITMNALVEEALTMIDQISVNAKSGEQSLSVMNESMGNISRSSQEMTGIIQIINDISDKINLLSLNAAIEAARAGDAGRGFAVVADEISKLADQTASSIKSIDTLIRTNESEIGKGNQNVGAAVEKINYIISDIEKIVNKITVISQNMSQQTLANQTVNENAEKVKTRSEQITNAMNEQKLAIEEISKTVGSINELSQHNTHQIIQITDSTKSIVARVENMHEEIDNFVRKSQLAGRDQ
ncbi:MAG TPA: methyl-accepting chemotaxis protein [Spirochaetota bacterium]|nr:methyl-accepting chemotaxis protein [Spirochaetota bacterium]HPV42109.1 methyl-accepting chemotaxis protein [Spirochaetota bacterium]